MDNNIFGEEVLSVGSSDPFSALAGTTEPIELGAPAVKAEEKSQSAAVSQEIKQETKSTTEVEDKIEDSTKKEPKNGSDKAKSKNPAFVIADSFKKDGVFSDDVKFSEEMSAKDLKNMLIDSTKKDVEEMVRSEYEQKYSPELLKTADMVNKGISPDDLQEVNYYKKLATVNLTDDDDKNVKIKEAMIRRMYEDKGISEKKIEKMIADSIEEDEGESDFEDAKKYFGTKAKALDSEIKASVEEADRVAVEKQETLNKEIKALIKSGDIYNTKDEKAKKALDSFLFDQTETVKIDGKQFRVTGFQKKLQEYQNDIKQQLTFAKLLLNGFDLTQIEDSGKNKAAEELDHLLGATLETNGKQKEDEEPTKVTWDFSKMQEIYS